MSQKKNYAWNWTIVIFTVLLPATVVSLCPTPGYVLDDCSKYNLAYQRPTSQSFNPDGAGLAVDANYSTCTATTPVVDPFWSVDLGKDMTINKLALLRPGKTVTKSNICGILTYDRPAVEGGNTRVNFNPTLIDINIRTEWFVNELSDGTWRQVTNSNPKYSVSDFSLMINSNRELLVQVYVQYGICRSDMITVQLENFSLMINSNRELLVQVYAQYGSCSSDTITMQLENEITSYKVEVRADGSDVWQVCRSIASSAPLQSPVTINCNSPLVGRHVRFMVPQNLTNLELCDVSIAGACLNGSYGNYCQKECGNCKPVRFSYQDLCNRITGKCTEGCQIGYTGDACHQDCPFNTYGQDCRQQCGNCFYNETCNKFTGECTFAKCENGYKSPMCQEECDDGTYGPDCTMDCGNCRYNAACNKSDGVCPGDCAAGYHPADDRCITPCEDLSYGQDCVQACGKCRQEGSTAPGPCDKVTGECKLGCAPGYYNNNNFDCTRACPLGTWGINCANSCGNCGLKNETTGVVKAVDCATVDGSCLTGCIVGWQGLLCAETCTPGTYGLDCDNTCGQCKDPCDHITGRCPGDCKNGYLGDMCTQACSAGMYGFKCQNRCPTNCQNRTCDITDGSCVCEDGWTGPTCEQNCPANHYGKDCAFVCGNCREGTTCNQHDGMCPDGCQDMWVGLKCDAKKIIEVYQRSYAGEIAGGVVGFIALILIGLFAAWVIWRYREDKSIHVRELAQSLRRMSLRGSKRIRRSLQRLSFRNKKTTTDKRQMGKDMDTPDSIDQHTHTRGKASVPRMYECVQLQSNVIHYDDFTRLYLQLQETRHSGRTLLYDSFQSFLEQRPKDHTSEQNGHSNGRAYFNAASTGVEDVQVEVGPGKTKIPAFLPYGSNLSGFLLVNTPAISETLWNHLRQRDIENIISVGKDATFGWTPGERIEIGQDVVDCVDMQLYASHRESKLTVQRRGVQGRRGVRHIECFLWNKHERFPNISTLLMFLDRLQQLQSRQRERSILVNYMSLYEQSIMLTLVASCLEIIREGKRVDILRTVATGGNPTVKSIRTFEEFKFLHDVVFQYMASSDGSTSI